ncbi:MAG: hypothetical protein HC846_08405 [Blastocatellia bacterium]|nr:hypothetical protein [Blastocatellia bacterium]
MNARHQSLNNSKSSSTLTETVSTENKSFKRRGRLQQKVRKLRHWRSTQLIRRVSWAQRFTSLLLLMSIFPLPWRLLLMPPGR